MKQIALSSSTPVSACAVLPWLRAAWACVGLAWFLAASPGTAQANLAGYDAVITGDATDGLVPLAKLSSPAILTGANSVPFNFGATSGDTTIEFIVEGNPAASGAAANLAVGANSTSSLRYNQWNSTKELGFTRNGVEDYRFSSGISSPTNITHVAYVWDATALTMSLYVNGSLAGSRAGVSATFAMPTGAGVLGSGNMVGTIHRVTVYNGKVAGEILRRHGNAFTDLVPWAPAPTLSYYDAVVDQDQAGGLTPLARLTNAASFNGTSNMAFDFGATAGDTTMEFIVEGNPAAGTGSSYLAVGANSGSNLRYNQWQNTQQLGFTQTGAADYLFSPAVASPTVATHVTYVWDSTTRVMKVYVNGALAGTASGVHANFAMPTGAGFLGANPGNGEAMTGTIHRVTVYSGQVSDSTIDRHAQAMNAGTRQLANYDAAITTDATGGFTPLGRHKVAATLYGTNQLAFDFGAVSGDATVEFILEGNPAVDSGSAYLAVGINNTSSLRYNQFNHTAQLGFTRSTVEDYLFTPAVSSPTNSTHIAYTWNAATLTMRMYVYGILAGTSTGITNSFSMPAGAGWLGANGGRNETMFGTIYRATVYGGVVSDEAILRHAEAYNRAPAGQNSAAAVRQNQTLILENPRLLTTASDPDGDPVSISGVAATSTNGGAVTLTATNTISYTPVLDFVGADRFSYFLADGRGRSSVIYVDVTVTPGNSGSLNVVSPPAVLPNGHFHVGFAGIPNVSYTVQYSPNADGPWTTITNITAGAHGLFEFEDPTEPAPATRFYRTVYP